MDLVTKQDILNNIVQRISANLGTAQNLSHGEDFTEALLNISMENITIPPDISKELLLELLIENMFPKTNYCLN